MLGLRPFFTYYGGKWRIAPRYPAPEHDWIVEPFAGSVGYSLRYPHRRVFLVEKNELVYRTWAYLVDVSEAEILGLPDIRVDQTVDDLAVCAEARILIGWWLNGGTAHPCKVPSKWMRSMPEMGGPGWTTGTGILAWGERVRQRIAEQLQYIRHWFVLHGSYEDAPDMSSTWFVDPPYNNKAGMYYKYGSDALNFSDLAVWCLSRRGQVIVCENCGADWLPFEPFMEAKANLSSGHNRVTKEAIWCNFDWRK